MRKATMIIIAFVTAFLAVLIACVINTIQGAKARTKASPKKFELIDAVVAKVRQDNSSVINRFSSALQFRTVSTKPHEYDRIELRKFGDFIFESTLLVHHIRPVANCI